MKVLKVLITAMTVMVGSWAYARGHFTDQTLRDVLAYSEAHQTAGAIYTWSPRMNLSITGVAEIVQITQELNLDLIILADPGLPDQELSAAAQNVLLQYSMKADSRVLEKLGISMHYPNLILYRNGMIDSIRPGYDEPVRVRDYILRRFR